MRLHSAFLAPLLVAAAFAGSGGQSPTQLTRTTAATGYNDSALVICSDSAGKTRACSMLETKRAISRGAFIDSIRTTRLNLTGGTTIGGATWGTAQTFAAGQRVDSSTGSARAQLLTTARTIGGTSFNGSANITPGLADSATGANRAQILTTARTIGGTSFNGSANIVPGFADSATGSARSQILTTARTIGGTSFNGSANIVPAFGDSSTGSARAQTLTTARALWGQSFNGSAAITGSLTSVGSVTGGASSMTVTAGTGASRTLTLQSTDASSVALNALVLGADTSVTAIGRFLAPNATATLPAFAFSGATGDGLFRPAGDTITFAFAGARGLSVLGGATAKLIGGAGNMTILGGSGASRTLTLQSSNASSAALNTLVLGADTSVTAIGRFLAPNATVTLPAYSFSGATADGLYRPAGDTVTFSLNGVRGLSVAGGATASLVGGAGNMTIVGGTGASRTMTLQSTNASSVALNTLVLGADTSVTAVGRFLAPNASVTLPAYSFSGATADGLYRPAGDTVTFAINGVRGLSVAGGAATSLIGGAGNMTLTAGSGVSRTLTINGTNGSSVVTALGTLSTSLLDWTNSANTRSAGGNPNSGVPGLQLQSASIGIGAINSGGSTDTLAVMTNSVVSLHVSGGATPVILGGAGSMTLISGTGNSRRLVAQTTTSGGTATTFLRANELQQTLHADGAVGTPGISFAADSILGLYRVGTAGASDTLMVAANGVVQMKIAPAGILRLPALPVEGSTKNAMCWDGTTFNVTQNAAATCTVSSSRFKHDIVPLEDSVADRVVFGLHPVTFRYNADDVRAIGVIAENADSVDSRLATRDAEGRIHSINYEQITASLLRVVQDQRDRIDSLAARLARAEQRIDSISSAAHDRCRLSDCILVPILRPTTVKP